MILRKTLTLFAVALLALTTIAAPTAAAELGSQTVTVDDPDTEEIEATVDLSDDPATQNTALELVNESGQTVETIALEGSSGETVNETFAVEFSGDYTVSLTADTTGVATLQSAAVVENSSGAAGLFGSTSTDQQFLWFGGIGAVAVIGMLAYREYENDGY